MNTEETIDVGIVHLDFPIEEEEKEPPKKNHFIHPIDPDKYWCGEPKPPTSKRGQPGLYSENGKASDVTCVECLHLYIAKGGAWWWRVNRAWYGD